MIPLQTRCGLALLFQDSGTRRGWAVSSTPQLRFTPGKDPLPILQEAGWAPGPVWMGGKSCPHWDLIPDRPSRSQSLYWLSYPAHNLMSCGNDKLTVYLKKLGWFNHNSDYAMAYDSGVQIHAGARDLSVLQNVHCHSGAHWASCSNR